MAKKTRIVIIGAGMAGITAANKLYNSISSSNLFELCVVEGGSRIGGRINTSEFGGDRIEMGATWIHGIGGSPIYKISQEINSLESQKPWECMDGFSNQPKTVAEGGFELNPTIVDPVNTLFDNLMDYAQGKLIESADKLDFYNLASRAFKSCCTTRNGVSDQLSVGSFLSQGLNAYWDSMKDDQEELKLKGYGTWSRKLLEEAIFAMHENTQRTYTSAGDLLTLDFNAESEYQMFPDEEITIAKGYMSVIEHLASVLPPGLIQLGRKVTNIEWRTEVEQQSIVMENGHGSNSRPVKIHFCDGSTMLADHVIVTVSLGVLKAGIHQDSGMLFNPPLPTFKTEAISRLGFGVVNKLFLQLSDRKGDDDDNNLEKFPFLQMAFHRPDSELRNMKIPWWMRRTASLSPIYKKSNVLLSWFAGEEALELETMSDEEIVEGVSTTISSFLSQPHKKLESNSHELCTNGKASEVKFTKVLKSKWGNDPLFLGSYSYVAVGSGGEDLDSLAEPLPKSTGSDSCESNGGSSSIPPPPLQILFAGEATHRTHYSTTHGAYFSGLREAKRLLQHYHHYVGIN
ncbi:hypothetical protein Dsin_015205 [Dipteronia sinensis]|uniref:Amine oxidase domain-containing protein n=1 Tax=Dipteronia sinensis TaxID=43782 RepID=A0AAE0E4F8_9ROSI|nr:hypothetical protein Dsin_015205 [Dipteronia sinensis]